MKIIVKEAYLGFSTTMVSKSQGVLGDPGSEHKLFIRGNFPVKWEIFTSLPGAVSGPTVCVIPSFLLVQHGGVYSHRQLKSVNCVFEVSGGKILSCMGLVKGS